MRFYHIQNECYCILIRKPKLTWSLSMALHSRVEDFAIFYFGNYQNALTVIESVSFT